MSEPDLQRLLQAAAARLQAGQSDSAERMLRDAIRSAPRSAAAHSLLGAILAARGRLEDAIATLRRAVTLDPNFEPAHYNLGNALAARGRNPEAIAAYERAVRLRPDDADAHNNLGTALVNDERPDEAIEAYRRATTQRPRFARAWNNLGNTLRDTGRVVEAIEAHRRAAAAAPDDPKFADSVLQLLYFHPDLDGPAIRREHDAWNLRYARPLAPAVEADPPDGPRLKVGYVSPDFFHQAESFFVLPLLQSHNRDGFEIHCYSSVVKPDAMTERMKAAAEVWQDVTALSDELLDARIRADGIHVLVDLTMHMPGNRLRVFARRPAPVQVTWLAYPGTTGLDAVDWRFADARMDPPGLLDADYSEKPAYLPDTWCCYDAINEVAEPGPPPAAARGAITFACLNGCYKVNAHVLRLWAKVLSAVPRSDLLLLAPSGGHRERTRDFLHKLGVSRDRVRFTGPLSRPAYLKLHEEIDIALDPFPYNGITTTCDALWTGVPVVSRIGSRAPARAGLSLLTQVGLPELVAADSDGYVRIAAELAGDLPRLTALRASLRRRMRESTLTDAPRFARNVETAYREMWRLRRRTESRTT